MKSHLPPDRRSRAFKTPAHTWAPNALIQGKYRIIRPIGKGGMGQVYEVERVDLPLPRRFALKAISREHCTSPTTRRRLEEEARVMAKLSNHKHMVEMIDFGVSEDDRMYYVMELLAGRTLYTELRLRQRQAEIDTPYVRWVLGLGAQVLSALEAAHAMGVVHRDVKPENVFLQSNGVAKLLDFGIAKILASNAIDPQRPEGNATTPGSFVGTPRYASPECVQAQPVDGRSDIFSVGVMLWELLAKTHPVPPGDLAAISVSIVLHGIPPLESRPGLTLPPKVCAAIRRATMPSPEDRYQTAREFIDALLDTLGALPGETAPWLLPASGQEIAVAEGHLSPDELAREPYGWPPDGGARGLSATFNERSREPSSTVNPLDNTRPTKRSPGHAGRVPTATQAPNSFPDPLEGDPTFNNHREAPTRTSELAAALGPFEPPSRTPAGQSVTFESEPPNPGQTLRGSGGLLRRITPVQTFAALACGVIALGAAGALLITRNASAPANRTAVSPDLSAPEPPPAPAAATIAALAGPTAEPAAAVSAVVSPPVASAPAEPPAVTTPLAAPTPAAEGGDAAAPSKTPAADPEPRPPAAREVAKPAKKRPKPASEAPLPVKRFYPVEMGKK